jgi:hypothetical protein
MVGCPLVSELMCRLNFTVLDQVFGGAGTAKHLPDGDVHVHPQQVFEVRRSTSRPKARELRPRWNTSTCTW